MPIQLMNAVVCTAYGPPETLKIKKVRKPIPKDNEVLVEIMATAVNSGDTRIRGFNLDGFFRIVMRFVLGFKKPKKPILGIALSGIVEEVGKNVTKFKPGDEVFASTGFKMGAYAQYTTVSEKGRILHKPKNASFEEAAAILFGGMSALYFLKKAGLTTRLKPKVLIYGATGSVGAAAVELAKYYQATVTAVCSEEGAVFAKTLGSDHVVIYTAQDFTKLNTKFDVVFDAVGKTKNKDCKGLLARGGKYITVGGIDIAKETIAQMIVLKELYENGTLNAHIDRMYRMERIVEAHRYVDTGRKKANVVVKID